MAAPDEDKWLEALAIQGAKITSTHRPTIACIEFQTPDGPKLFLAKRESMLELGQGIIAFAKQMPSEKKKAFLGA